MKELEIIYKILNALRKAMDIEEPSVFPITADGLKISEAKWARLMKMLCDNGYIADQILPKTSAKKLLSGSVLPECIPFGISAMRLFFSRFRVIS